MILHDSDAKRAYLGQIHIVTHRFDTAEKLQHIQRVYTNPDYAQVKKTRHRIIQVEISN